MEQYETKDLGCAVFLYTKGLKRTAHKRDGHLVTFTFEPKEEAEKLVQEYYKNGEIPALSFWHSLKILKNIIHERG